MPPHPAASLAVLPADGDLPAQAAQRRTPRVQHPAPHAPHLQPQRPAPARPCRGCCSHAAGSLLHGLPHGRSAQPQPAGRRAQGRHRGAPAPTATSAPAPRSRSAGRPWQLGLLLDVASPGGTSRSFTLSHPHRHGRAQPSCTHTHTGAQAHTHGDARAQTWLSVPTARACPCGHKAPPGAAAWGRGMWPFCISKALCPRQRELGLLASHFTDKWGSLSLQTPCPTDPGAR